MEDIAGFADRILVMNKARLFCFDETEKVFARAEEISKIGLDVPQVTKIFLKLKEQGLDFGKDVYTMEYAKNLLLKKLSERGGV
jgi:energy-coupling factor transport system ATP-binding protein